jgi:hypothetical protein
VVLHDGQRLGCHRGSGCPRLPEGELTLSQLTAVVPRQESADLVAVPIFVVVGTV